MLCSCVRHRLFLTSFGRVGGSRHSCSATLTVVMIAAAAAGYRCFARRPGSGGSELLCVLHMTRMATRIAMTPAVLERLSPDGGRVITGDITPTTRCCSLLLRILRIRRVSRAYTTRSLLWWLGNTITTTAATPWRVGSILTRLGVDLSVVAAGRGSVIAPTCRLLWCFYR